MQLPTLFNSIQIVGAINQAVISKLLKHDWLAYELPHDKCLGTAEKKCELCAGPSKKVCPTLFVSFFHFVFTIY